MVDRFYEQVFRSQAGAKSVDVGLRSYMCKVYAYMSLGLVLTAGVSFVVASSYSLQKLFFGTPLLWVVVFSPFAIVFFLGSGINRINASTAKALFWGYAALMGVSLSSVLILYTGESVARVFFITASMFGGMSLYGYTTERDLSEFGSFLIMGMMGVCLASLVNLFLGSSALHFALSVLSVIIFTGITAYDTQQIRSFYRMVPVGMQDNAALLSALTLYTDFVGLFMNLMRLLGDRK